MRIVFVHMLAACVILSATAHAMTEKQIDDAIEKGRKANDEKAVPLFERAGGVKAPSDMLRDAILPLSGAGYFILVGSCKQWIQNTVYRATAAGEEVPAQLFYDPCSGRDELRVAVLGEYDSNAAFGVMTFSFPLGPRPVKSIFLRVDGEERHAKPVGDFDKFGEGNGYAVFDAEGLQDAKRIWIVITIEGLGDELRRELVPKVIRKLYR